MKPQRVLAPQDTLEILDRAVQERALAVLTLQQGNDWCTYKSRFLERDRAGRFFVLDHEPAPGSAMPAVSPGQYVGVSFRQRSRKVLFATVIEAKGHFVLDDRTSVAAIRYRWPQTMTELQRRAYYRTPVPPQLNLLVSLWPGGVTARAQTQNPGLQVLTGDLADMSCGGAQIHLHHPTPTAWNENDLLGVEMQLPDGRPPIVVDVHYRGSRQDASGVLGIAVQFIGLELTLDGRNVLQRLANSVQRLHRLGQVAGHKDPNHRPRP